MTEFTQPQLAATLDQKLTANSLHVLCFRLGVDHDNLEGATKYNRIISLITHLERRGALPKLVLLLETDALPEPGEQLALTFPMTYQLPPANPHFTGRELLLARLGEAGAGTVAITQAIAGMGGVGKTQLALAYAHQRRSQFDLIAWLNGSEATLLDSDLQQLGRLLRLPLPPSDAAAARQMVLAWLGSSNKRWLLLYDNLDQLTPAQLRPYLPPTPSNGSQILLTSRSPHWGGVAQVVDVNVFTPQEAMLFLRQRLGGEQPGLAELAAALGYLPLALAQAAAYMETRGVAADGYRRLFQARRRELWRHETAPDDYHATVATTWNIGFEQVRGVAGAAELLALGSFLAGDGIPLPLLLPSFANVAQLQNSPLRDELGLAEVMAALRRYALLEGNAESVRMHRLLQTVYRDQMGAEAAAAWLETVINLLKASLPDWTRLHEWTAGTQLLPHMIMAADLAEQLGLANEQSAFLDNWIGYTLQFWGNFGEARPYYERALSIYEKVLGPEHPDTATSLNNLGGLLDSMGNLAEARPYYERALGIREKVLGPEHPDTAQSLNNLGGLLDSMGNLAEARPYYERALDIREKVLGPEHPDTATSLSSLGYLLQAMGNLAEARPYYERALDIREKVLGPEHPDTAQSLNNLAILAYYEGDLAEAARLMQRALGIWERRLGANHPNTQTARQSLAVIEGEMGGGG